MTSTETSRPIPPATAGPEIVNRNNKTSPKRGAPDEPMPDAGSPLPKIVVKKEPASPIASGPPSARHRPPKLSLNKTSGVGVAPRTSGALTAGGNHLMQEVGMACLSPGFTTQDPAMREQLARSISVRDQQRSIIEQRLQRHSGNGNTDAGKNESNTNRGDRSSKRRPPSSLTIVPPSHRAFEHERVIQSAPLNQTFTGRGEPYQPAHLRQQQPAQNVNRLPPIADVFAGDRMDLRTSSRFDPANSNKGPQTTTGQSFPPPFPAYPSPNQINNNRSREFRSAEEAINSLTGGREELHPKVVHYGGHQPPTPPSPPQQPGYYKGQPNGPPTSRRRDRNEYERDGRDGSYGSDDNGTKRRKKDEKKEEFLALCARAWDLLHS